jgi:uncharacterized protein YegP (UPF0339 family)
MYLLYNEKSPANDRVIEAHHKFLNEHHQETNMAGKFTIRKTDKGNFVFNLKASNGQVILTSQPYDDKRSAINGIESARRNGENDANFERRMASNGQPYFVLKAANAQIIGQSEMYSAKATMEKGIASVRRNAPSAPLEDLTTGA